MAGRDDAPDIAGIEGLQLIGRGGFAVVYRGHQPAFRRDVAVKVLLRSGLDVDDRRRFDRECQAMGLLSDHPGIITLYDAGFTDDGRPYLVMAYVRDGSLADRLASDGPMTWPDVTVLGVRLAGALETAHRAGVLHRDIKPANVLRSEYGDQLSDFGIARIAGGHETRSGLITASIAHAAPEILDGDPPTFRADVYALGSTLYEAVTGRAAFVRDTDEGLLPLIRRVVSDDPPDLRNHGVPDTVARVIETAMAKDPAERYASARALGLALRGAQAVLGIPVTDLVVVGDAGPEADTPDTDSALAATTGVITGRDDPAPGAPARPPAAHDATATNVVGTPGASASTTVVPTGPPPTPPTGWSSHEPEHRDGRGESRKAALIAGVFLALIALVVGLIVFTRDDTPADPPDATAAPTVVDGTATDTLAPGTTVEPTGDTAPPGTEPIDPDVVPSVRLGAVTPNVDPSHPVPAAVNAVAAELGLPLVVGDTSTPPGDEVVAQISDGQTAIVTFAPPPLVDETADAVGRSADAHPEVDFVLVDAVVDAPNVASITFAEEQGSFLVGAAAALTSTTGRIGFLGGGDTDRNRRYEAGYVAGARHVAPTVQIDVRYLPGTGELFDDRDLAFALADDLFLKGADVVYHAGTSGEGLFDAAAQDPGRWAIGSDTDQAAFVDPDRAGSILTSMIKSYDPATRAAVSDAADGELTGGVVRLGVAEGGVTWSTTGGHVDAIDPQLAALADELASGTVVAPSTVESRALAPQGASCPDEGCRIRIIGAEPQGDELALTLEANWELDVGALHAHYYWSPRYTSAMAGADSAERFGVEVGDWDLDDSYPVYVTEGSVSLSGRGSDTEICVTAADPGHNVLDPDLFHCATITDLVG